MDRRSFRHMTQHQAYFEALRLETIPREPDINELRFVNFSESQQIDFLQRYERSARYHDMDEPTDDRIINYHNTTGFLKAIKKLPTDRVPSVFPRAITPYEKNPIFYNNDVTVITSLASQVGFADLKTNVLLKEVLLSEVIHKNRDNPIKMRKILTSLALEMYIANFFEHDNLLSAIFVYQEPQLARYHIAFEPNVTLQHIIDEKVARLPRCQYIFDDLNAARYIVSEVGKAIQYLFERRISHNAINPQSIYIDHQGHVRLGDFLLSVLNLWPDNSDELPPDDNNNTDNIGPIPFHDIKGLGNVYAKLVIPRQLEQSYSVLYLMNKFTQQYASHDRSVPISRGEVNFIMQCVGDTVLPHTVLSSTFLARAPNASKALKNVISSLSVNIAKHVMTGPEMAPQEEKPDLSSFLNANPHVEFLFHLEEVTSLNTLDVGYLIEVKHDHRILQALAILVNSERNVTFSERFNFEPSDIFAINASMLKLLHELDFQSAELRSNENDTEYATDYFKTANRVNLGHDGRRVLTITARLHSIDDLIIERPETVSPRVPFQMFKLWL